MKELTESEKSKERSVLTGFLVGFISLFPFLYIMYLSKSVILMAEAFRSGNETLACLVSLITLRLIHRHPGEYPRLERLTSLFVGAVMCLSVLVILFNAGMKFLRPAPITLLGGLLGIGAAAFSGTVNLWLWLKNLKLAASSGSAVMDSQWRLFRAKFAANCSVTLTLAASLALASFSFSLYLDPAISVALALFILYSAIRIFKNSSGHEVK